jgi:hypothetical protein
MKGSLLRGGDSYEFNVRPADFEIFGVEGPALPHRIPEHDEAHWSVPIRHDPLPAGARVDYVLVVKTANRKAQAESRVYSVYKSFAEPLFDLPPCTHSWSSFQFAMTDLPQEIVDWVGSK